MKYCVPNEHTDGAQGQADKHHLNLGVEGRLTVGQMSMAPFKRLAVQNSEDELAHERRINRDGH